MTGVDGLPPPAHSYLVCATPRSGSTLLCKALASTGVAGNPEEYFEARRQTGRPPTPADYLEGAPELPERHIEGPPAPDYSSLEGVDDYRDHLRAALELGTTPNGVFGAKLMWSHLEDLVPLAHSLAELSGTGVRELLETLFGDPVYVWVRRDDSVRQAVSLWRAIQTQAWRSGSEEEQQARDPRYDFDAIHHLRSRLLDDDAAWGDFFKAEGIESLMLWYEDLAEDPDAGVQAVLAAVEADTGDAKPARASTTRQADDLSERWVTRYQRDAMMVR